MGPGLLIRSSLFPLLVPDFSCPSITIQYIQDHPNGHGNIWSTVTYLLDEILGNEYLDILGHELSL